MAKKFRERLKNAFIEFIYGTISFDRDFYQEVSDRYISHYNDLIFENNHLKNEIGKLKLELETREGAQ